MTVLINCIGQWGHEIMLICLGQYLPFDTAVLLNISVFI